MSSNKLVPASLLCLLSLVSCGAQEDPELHPDFTLTVDQLEEIVADVPAPAAAAIARRPQYFLEMIKQALSGPEELLFLVDKKHKLPENYAPDDLVRLDDYRIAVNRRGLELRAILMPDLLAMIEAARLEGLELVLSSTYRSYDYQAALYQRNVAQLGKEAADRESAQPGASQHQLGTTADFGSITDAFAATDEGVWLSENAWKFGFSLSYPVGGEEKTGYRYESWHYRYIGRDAARLEHEFFNGIQQDLMEFLHEKALHLRGSLK